MGRYRIWLPAVVVVAAAVGLAGCGPAPAAGVAVNRSLSAENPTEKPNLIANGDFAAGPKGWQLRHKDPNVIWDADGGEGRAKCLRAPLFATKLRQRAEGNIDGELREDRLYELSADVKCDVEKVGVEFGVFCGHGITRSFVCGKDFAVGKWATISEKVICRKDPDGRKLVQIGWQPKGAVEKQPAYFYATGVRLREIGVLDVSQPSGSEDNLLVNGDFEKGLENWRNNAKGGFELSDKGFEGRCAVLKKIPDGEKAGAQEVLIPNEDALYRLTYKMKAENTLKGGKLRTCVVMAFHDLQNRGRGFYYVPAPIKEDGVWLDKTCYFFAERMAGQAGGSSPQLKVMIAFDTTAAGQETQETYSFANVRLVRVDKALQGPTSAEGRGR